MAGRGGPRPIFTYGRPGVPPLRFYKNIFESLDGRVLDPPLRRIRKPSVFMVGAGPRPARVSRAHPHPPQCAHWGTFPLKGGRLAGKMDPAARPEPFPSSVWPSASHLSPGEGLTGIALGTIVWNTQAQKRNRTKGKFCARRAQWPGGNLDQPLRFCAPEILQNLTGTRPPVMGDRG